MANQGGFKAGLRKALWIFLGLVVAGVAITFLVFNYTYSEGSRAGVLIKFDKKGAIFKTYEGELNIGGVGNVPGTAQMNQTWDFSVRDNAMADSLMGVEGKKVSLHYKQVLKNMWWQGDTKYFVDGYKVIE